MAHAELVPVTILTGFLGSGKTTLLNRLLRAAHGERIAVIENELGEVGIDGALLLDATGAEIVEMANGCICCTVRGDLTRSLSELAGKRDRGELRFDRVVVETTGVADPGPVAQTFFVEPDVTQRYRLDGIVTLVDAVHGASTLDAQREARRQVGFADRLLVTKTDLAAECDVQALAVRLRRMNARAPLKRSVHGAGDASDVLDLGGFELDGALGIDPHFLNEPHAHRHEDDIASFVWRSAASLDLTRIEEFLGLAIERFGDDLLRYKGVLDVEGRTERIVLQGVQRLVGCDAGRRWAEGEARESVIVFIGRNLPREALARGLNLCAAGAVQDPASALRDAA
ncbi:MAG TPA: GTP-binding protein [Burkholderiales bacterium]|nr:GTP-binding protein [Burkholderiales bacterium]